MLVNLDEAAHLKAHELRREAVAMLEAAADADNWYAARRLRAEAAKIEARANQFAKSARIARRQKQQG